MTSPENRRKRPQSANRDKYLTKTAQYIYSPYKKKNNYESFDNKFMAIQSSIDRIFSREKPVKNIDLKSFKSILRSSSPFQEKNEEGREKVKSLQVTPKHSKKDKNNCFASTASKTFSVNMSMKKTTALKATQREEGENHSALKDCQLKIDYYQKLYEEQCEEKKLLQQLVDSIKNEINKSEKDQTKMNKSSQKFFFEKEKEKKNLAKQETSSQNMNKEISNVANEALKLREELTEIQNVKNELQQKIVDENERIKKTMDFGQKLKNEISSTNRHKEKIKMTLMSSNRKLNGFTEKINILQREKDIFVSKLQATVAMT